MKAFEVAKGAARGVLTHGRVMMAIEGEDSRIAKVYKDMKADGFFDSTDCAEEGDKEGTTAYFFMIDRADKEHFIKMWKVHKHFA